MERKNSEKKQSKYDEYISQVDPSLLSIWKSEQNSLKSQLVEKDDFNFNFKDIKLIGGMDISASKKEPNVAIAALVVVEFKTLKIVYEKYELVTMTQPYVPGFLAFREVDHLTPLINTLKEDKPDLVPDIILLDGNGIIHSNRFGLACHLGVLCDIPTIGCAKTVFSVDGITKYKVKKAAESELINSGDYTLLIGDSGDCWGAAMKTTKKSYVPMIVSIGHRISLDSAIEVVRKCCRFRVPEPIRISDKRSRLLIDKYEKDKVYSFDIDYYLRKMKQNLDEE